MKKIVAVVMAVVGAVQAQMIVLEGIDVATVTTGDLLDGADHTGRTNSVVEIAGLEIRARTGGSDQDINVTGASLGITIFGSGDDTDAFEVGEKMILSFNKDIQINRFDFNQFSTDESIMVSIDGIAFEITDSGLSNRSSDYLDTNLVVSADTEIEFFTTGSSVIGLDGLDVTVLEASSELMLSLISSNGTASVSATFTGAASTNYILQHLADLTDTNGWVTVSGPFAADSAWNIETTNHSGFYRAVAE